MKLAITHTPFREALGTKTAGDRLWELAADMSKRCANYRGNGFLLSVENKGIAFVINLSAREGKGVEMTPTGCYVSVTTHQVGPRKALRVAVNFRALGPFSDTINRRAGIEVLNTLAHVLQGATEGFEFAD